MSTMRRSAAGAGKIPVLSLPSGQASSLLANRATTVRGDVLRRDDLREFRSAYNSSGGKPIHTAPTRRGFTPGKVTPHVLLGEAERPPGFGPPLTGEPLPPWTPHPVRLRAQ
jgi:hypothetical protein